MDALEEKLVYIFAKAELFPYNKGMRIIKIIGPTSTVCDPTNKEKLIVFEFFFCDYGLLKLVIKLIKHIPFESKFFKTFLRMSAKFRCRSLSGFQRRFVSLLPPNIASELFCRVARGCPHLYFD